MTPTDSVDTWIAIYGEAGEKGLMDYSTSNHDPNRGIGHTVEKAYLFRLAGVASKHPLSYDEFYRIASKIPNNLTRFIIGNRNCPESLIEDLWVGNYVDAFGRPDPTAVISQAFYSNHYKMTAVYARRPDLRMHVAEYMRPMVESSLLEDKEALLNAS